MTSSAPKTQEDEMAREPRNRAVHPAAIRAKNTTCDGGRCRDNSKCSRIAECRDKRGEFQDTQQVARDQPACGNRQGKHQYQSCWMISVCMRQGNDFSSGIRIPELRNTRGSRVRDERDRAPNRIECKRHEGADRNSEIGIEAGNAEPNINSQRTIVSRRHHRSDREDKENEVDSGSCNRHRLRSNFFHHKHRRQDHRPNCTERVDICQ